MHWQATFLTAIHCIFYLPKTEYPLPLEEYVLVDKPKRVIWTSAEVATSIFFDLTIPSFTNIGMIYITSDVITFQESHTYNSRSQIYSSLSFIFRQIWR